MMKSLRGVLGVQHRTPSCQMYPDKLSCNAILTNPSAELRRQHKAAVQVVAECYMRHTCHFITKAFQSGDRCKVGSYNLPRILSNLPQTPQNLVSYAIACHPHFTSLQRERERASFPSANSLYVISRYSCSGMCGLCQLIRRHIDSHLR